MSNPNALNRITDLDAPLLQFSGNPTDCFRLRDALEGVQIFGGIGSGKTSGSGRAFATSYLKSGFGGLVLTAKPDETAEWVKYARECGREEDLLIFSEGSKWKFNPLQYETARSGRGAGLTINITNLFLTIFKMGQRINGGGAEEKERFWENSLTRCLNRVIDLLKLANEEVSIYNMVEVVSCAPVGDETLRRLAEMNDSEIQEWAEKDFCIKCLYQAGNNSNTPQQDRDFSLVQNYFLRDFAGLDERVRSTVKEMLLGLCEPFLTGILYDHFSSETNITPEVTFEGKIIVLDFPVKNYLVAGIYAQSLFKYLWQQAVERRDTNRYPLPVFLWVDESQYFVQEFDTIFQTTARSSRACTVFLTQNISNYYAQMGGQEAMSKVDSLLGNLSTKVFHCQNCSVTNEWASKTIGHNMMAVEGGTYNRAMFTAGSSRGESYNMQLLPQVLPVEFTTLWTGGKTNDFKTQAIITVKGRTWSDGRNYMKLIFTQKA
ncbi:MAG: TraM recognition domain-containing protein [Saprospiraceae bacterium]